MSAGPPFAAGTPPVSEPAGMDGLAVACLLLGGAAIVTSLFVVGGVFGVLAIVLGIAARRRSEREHGRPAHSSTTAGIVLGAVAVGIAGAVLAYGVTVLVQHRGDVAEFRHCLNAAQTNDDRSRCVSTFLDEVAPPDRVTRTRG